MRGHGARLSRLTRWWVDPDDEFEWHRTFAEANGLTGQRRVHVALLAFALAGAGLALQQSPAGSPSGWESAVGYVAAGWAAVVGVMFLLVAWPCRRVSYGIVVSADLGITAVLATYQNGPLRLAGCVWFAVVGAYVTFTHGRVTHALHSIWAAGTVAGFGAWACASDGADIGVCIALMLAMACVVVAIPLMAQPHRDALRANLEHSQSLATYDPLTGLLNRRGLEAAAIAVVDRARESSNALVVMVLDLDAFKTINDNYGHRRGDQVLAEVAHRLEATLRRGAVLARTGGEEFVILDAVARSDVALLAERLRRAVHEADYEITVTTSIGIAVIGPRELDRTPAQGLESTLDQWFHDADAAMYAAKQRGGNQVRVATEATPPPSEPALDGV
jgi:diguanylate cyclase (GGDEF)-like protein